MRKLILSSLMLCSSSALAASPEFAGRFGLSAGMGRDQPILANKFDKKAEGGFVAGFYLRYQISEASGLQFGYTRFEWGHSPTAARIYDLVYMHRLAKRHWFTPIWGAGLGLVDIANYDVDENLKLGLKARIGIEYALSRDLILDGVIDGQFVGKMPGESRNLAIGEMYAIAPQLILSYFFGGN